MQTLSVVRPEGCGAHGALTSIAILFFVVLTGCGGSGSGAVAHGAPAPGSLDSSFDTDGIVTTTIGTFDSASALALQSDGKIVVAGTATISGVENFALARYNSDGTLDPSFGAGGIVTTMVTTTGIAPSSNAYALGLQPDGKIVVAGRATNNGVDYFFALARYTSTGGLDPTFDFDGIVTTTTIGTSSNAFALGLQTDGNIVVAGNADGNIALARYTSAGALDPSFDTDGIVTTPIGASSTAFALALQSDGKIVVAGISDGDIALARYTSAGALDPSFDTDGIVTTTFASNAVAFALALQSDGKIVVAGDTGGEIVLARYTSAGALDTTFDTDGIVTTIIGATSSNAFALALQSDGKIVVAGKATNNGVDFFIALARYMSTGALDTTFGTSGIVTTVIGAIADASAVALQSDGKIVAAGSADGSIAIARYNP